MTLPPPPVDQGAGNVQVPRCDCRCGPLTVLICQATKSAAGAVTQIPSPLDQYNAASFGALANTGGSVSGTAYYTTEGQVIVDPTAGDDWGGSGPGSTTTDYYNAGNANYVAYAGLQYKFHIDFACPWIGGYNIVLSWREKTEQQSGTSTQVFPAGATSPNPKTYSESASETYVPMTETLTPAAGALSVESSVYTIEATDLAEGATVRVVGPNATRFLAPGFQVFTYESAGVKSGFLPYTQPESGPGALIDPQPVYTRETASVAPGAAAGLEYSGAQDSTGAAVAGFSGNVPGKFVSRANTAVTGTATSDQLAAEDAMSNIRQAVAVSPTVVQWPQWLVMTLSNPASTDTLTGPVNAAVAAIDFATDFPSGQAEPAPQMESAIVAVRNLPAHEQSYTARKGVYSVWIYFTITGGLVSLLGQPAPLINAGELEFSWTRETIDLDTGARVSAAMAWTLSFTGVPGASNPTSGLPVTGAYFVSLYNEEDVPAANQRVEISGLEITNATLDCLVIPPQAEVVAAVS